MRFFLMLTLVFSGNAMAALRSADEITDALRLLRREVIVFDMSRGGKVALLGQTTIAAALFLGVSVFNARVTGGYVRPNQARGLYAAAAAGLGLGGVTTWYGHQLKKKNPRHARLDASPTYYQSRRGLSKFLLLPHNQQEELARENPGLAKFLIEMAEEYRRRAEYDLADDW